jgi:hypothetical protein
VTFGKEIMVPDNPIGASFSIISLAIALDSGWYETNSKLADSYTWGKGKGCSLINKQCRDKRVSEFCRNEREKGCSDDGEYVTICNKNPLTGRCKINTRFFSCKPERKPSLNAFHFGRDAVCLRVEVLCEFYFLFPINI